MKKIRFLLRERLFEKHMKVSDLSRATGIRRSTLDLIHNNKAQMVDLSVLAQLCVFFDCELSELMVSEQKNDCA